MWFVTSQIAAFNFQTHSFLHKSLPSTCRPPPRPSCSCPSHRRHATITIPLAVDHPSKYRPSVCSRFDLFTNWIGFFQILIFYKLDWNWLVFFTNLFKIEDMEANWIFQILIFFVISSSTHSSYIFFFKKKHRWKIKWIGFRYK